MGSTLTVSSAGNTRHVHDEQNSGIFNSMKQLKLTARQKELLDDMLRGQKLMQWDDMVWTLESDTAPLREVPNTTASALQRKGLIVRGERDTQGCWWVLNEKQDATQRATIEALVSERNEAARGEHPNSEET